MKSRHVGPKKITRSVIEKDTKPRKGDKEFHVQKVRAEPVDDEKQTKKQKKKMDKLSGQLAILGEVRPSEVRKTMKINFGKAADTIIDMLEMNDNDGAMVLLQKRLLQSSVSMLTLAEKAMRDSQGVKGTYQYATLVSQIRELITDIQAGRDRSFIANQVIDQAIRPAFIDVAEYILNDHQAFRKEMLENKIIRSDKQLEFNTALRSLAKELATKMHDRYKTLSFSITQQLTS